MLDLLLIISLASSFFRFRIDDSELTEKNRELLEMLIRNVNDFPPSLVDFVQIPSNLKCNPNFLECVGCIFRCVVSLDIVKTINLRRTSVGLGFLKKNFERE